MNKQEFFESLNDGLSGLPQDDIEERIAFYNEIIEDKIEDGLTQEDAISQIGSVESIVSQIIAETPITKLVKEKIAHRQKLKAWEILLLVLGSPIWLSLLISVFTVVISLYISLWAIVISLWAVFASVIACGFGGVLAGMAFAFSGKSLIGIAIIGAGIACLGVCVFLFFVCQLATKGMVLLTKKTALCI